MRTLQSKRMAKELKTLCGNLYHPRKYDLENINETVNPSNRGTTMKRHTNQSLNFKPLSQIQGIPPYIHYINPPNNPHQPYRNHNNQPIVFNRPVNQQVINEVENPNNNVAAMNSSTGYQQSVFNQGAVQAPPTYFHPSQISNFQNQVPFFR